VHTLVRPRARLTLSSVGAGTRVHTTGKLGRGRRRGWFTAGTRLLSRRPIPEEPNVANVRYGTRAAGRTPAFDVLTILPGSVAIAGTSLAVAVVMPRSSRHRRRARTVDERPSGPATKETIARSRPGRAHAAVELPGRHRLAAAPDRASLPGFSRSTRSHGGGRSPHSECLPGVVHGDRLGQVPIRTALEAQYAARRARPTRPPTESDVDDHAVHDRASTAVSPRREERTGEVHRQDAVPVLVTGLQYGGGHADAGDVTIPPGRQMVTAISRVTEPTRAGRTRSVSYRWAFPPIRGSGHVSRSGRRPSRSIMATS